jgi:hypothetical protein
MLKCGSRLNKLRYPGQVTAILAAGHHLPFEVKGVNVDLPELQVRSGLLCSIVDHSFQSIMDVDHHAFTTMHPASSQSFSPPRLIPGGA